ncbi:nucleoside-diphosphate-sugar epimerase [Conyzicola nivalis]|uniref:Nucleoside-diphosphate-sugar epimerase n=1 Tax=Conyzicola nivalis TaxID=1477021 RepID=A0ABV2QMS6_9MICO
MRVLLAGASGVLGRTLLPFLTRAGHTVTGITRTRGSVTALGAPEVVADILDRPSLLASLQGAEFDAVIALTSARAHIPRRYTRMRQINRLRTEGTSALIAAARATGATRFVAASDFAGYGLEDFDDVVLDEEAAFGAQPGGPIDVIQRSALSNEQQARAFGGVALRFGAVYRGRGDAAVVASDWRRDLPFVHVDDAASATVSALDAEPGSVFNVVDDTPASWTELQFERAHAFQQPDPTRLPSWVMRRTSPFAAELLTATSMRVSNARARAELGWAPAYGSYREGVWSEVTDAAQVRAVQSGPSRASGAAHGSA